MSKDYVHEAIEAAKHELQSRDLSPERVVELEAITEESKKEKEAKESKPLPWVVRIFMLIFAIGIPKMFLSEYYKNRGYTKKAEECWTWMIYGFIFYFILAVISLFVNP